MTELIIARRSGQTVEEADLSTRHRLTVGRSPNTDLVVDNPSISRHHVILFLHGTKWMGADLGSRTGVHTQSGQVRCAELGHGQWLRIGALYCWLNQPRPSRELVRLPELPESWFRAGLRSDYIEARRSREDLLDEHEVDTARQAGTANGDGTDVSSAAPRLVVADSSGNAVCDAPLTAVEKLTIGRSSQCDLILNDPSVSRLHCVVYPTGGRWFVVDLGSSSGTVVDGRRVLRKRLNESSVVEIGRVMLWAEHLEAPLDPDEPMVQWGEAEANEPADGGAHAPGSADAEQPTAPTALSAFLGSSEAPEDGGTPAT